ncbi:hypothetical protein FRC00_006504 [Tulasnella sp. 408]|nr:hypothetical protein FRC00_006504 [Tulasnella sp. 408]
MDSPCQVNERTDEKQISKALLLPPELIYAIARQIPRTADLLSFGLVRSSFHDVVIPYYLKFREVIMEVNDINMWDYLVGDPRRLASVEVLKIVWSYLRGTSSSQPPLPENTVHAEGDPLDKIQRALGGMTRLREIQWNDDFMIPKPLEERQAGMNECQQKFWAVMPKLCKRVDTITLLTALSLESTELQVLPDIQFPSLVTLSLVGVTFDANDDPLRMLASCPRIMSLHLDFDNSPILAPDRNQGGSPPSLNIAPLLTSFTGHCEDAQILFFNPLPDGRLRRISRLKILGMTADGLLPPLRSAFEHSDFGVGQDLLELRIHTKYSRIFLFNENVQEHGPTLWVTCLRTIVKSCPKLRGLIIEIRDPDTGYDYLDETNDWGPTLSRLKDLSVLKLPATFYQEEATLHELPDVEKEQRVVERCLKWFPHLRLCFLANWVLVVDSEETKSANSPKRENLSRCGQSMGRYWAVYNDPSWRDFEEQIERLTA